MADLRVFGKTPRGTAELAGRSGELSLAQRRLLILIDGVRDAGQLAAIVPTGFEEALRVLEQGGYISLVGESTRTVQPASMSIPVAEMTTVQEAKVRAAKAVTDLLGPTAKDLAASIEAATSGDDLRPLIREAERRVAEAHGEEAAQAFILAIRRR
jgi:hypothetical protein